MYPQLVLSLVLAAAPFQATPATQKPAAETAKAAPAAKGVRTVEIVGTEDMKFSMATIAAKPGEQLRIRLVAKGSMPKIAMAHNLVVLNKSAKVVDFATAAMNARATDFIPAEKKADILAHTALAGAGETVEVTFKVPAAAGEYPYLCSFPGHFQAGMKGSLVVK